MHVLWLGLLGGCASFAPALDPPKISLVSLRSLPGTGGSPRFEIKLLVMNPNKQALDIAGISYSIELLGRELITGVANDVPPIAAYGEGIVVLDAGLQWLELLDLMASLGTTRSEPLAYRFAAKIDFHGLMPTQRLEQRGELSLH